METVANTYIPKIGEFSQQQQTNAFAEHAGTDVLYAIHARIKTTTTMQPYQVWSVRTFICMMIGQVPLKQVDSDTLIKLLIPFSSTIANSTFMLLH